MQNCKTTIITSIFTFLLLILPGNTFGIEFEKEDIVHISNLHTIDDDLIALADRITIDGEIEGDLIGAALKIYTNGKIKNSVTILGTDYIHSGNINGSVRMLTESAQIDGYIGRSVIALSKDFNLGSKGNIAGDVIIYGNIINIDGRIEGSADIKAKKVYVTGTIKEDLTIEADVIKLIPPAVIRGDFTYTSKNQADIDINSGVTIVGETLWNLPDDSDKDDSDKIFTDIVYNISEILAAFIFGVILLSLSRKYIQETINQLQNRFGVAAATGFLSIIILVICLIILIISAILTVAGYILISSDNAILGVSVLAISTLMLPITSFITVSGGVLLYSGKIIIGFIVGYYFIKLFKPKTKLISRIKLLIGLIILFILFSLPYLGYLISFLVATIGTGAIIQGIKHCRHESSPTLK